MADVTLFSTSFFSSKAQKNLVQYFMEIYWQRRVLKIDLKSGNTAEVV